jgi:hypothetical protein
MPLDRHGYYNRWGRMGLFAWMLTELAADGQSTGTVDATHRTATSLRAQKGGEPTSAAASSGAPRAGWTPSCMWQRAVRAGRSKYSSAPGIEAIILALEP